MYVITNGINVFSSEFTAFRKKILANQKYKMKSMTNIRRAVVEVIPDLESASPNSFHVRKFSDFGGKQPCFDEFVDLMKCMSQHTHASISCKGRYESLKLCIERL
jgi:hypothetical protein